MPSAAKSYEPVQEYESLKLLDSLIHYPSAYERWFEMHAAGVIFWIGFGRWIEMGTEPELERITKVGKTVERVAEPGSYLLDAFPLLNYIPNALALFKQGARRLRVEELSLFRKLQQDVRSDLEHGIKPPSFSKTFLENQDAYQLSDDEGAYVIGTLFEAGSGTTAAAMMSFCLAMCHFPEW